MSVAGLRGFIVLHKDGSDLDLVNPAHRAIERALDFEIRPGCFQQQSSRSWSQFPDNRKAALGCCLLPDVYFVVRHNPALSSIHLLSYFGGRMQLDKLAAFPGVLICSWFLGGRSVGRRVIAGTQPIERHANKNKNQNSAPAILFRLWRAAMRAGLSAFADLVFAVSTKGHSHICTSAIKGVWKKLSNPIPAGFLCQSIGLSEKGAYGLQLILVGLNKTIEAAASAP